MKRFGGLVGDLPAKALITQRQNGFERPPGRLRQRLIGGTEQYFKRTAERLRHDTGDVTKAALAVVVDEILTDESDPLMLLRNVRLSPSQAERLRQALEEIVDDLSDEADAPRYGVMVGL